MDDFGPFVLGRGVVVSPGDHGQEHAGHAPGGDGRGDHHHNGDGDQFAPLQTPLPLGQGQYHVDGDQQKKKQAVRRRGRRGKAHGRALDQHGGMGYAEGDGNAQQGTEKQAAERDVGVGAFPSSGRSAFGETGPQTGGDFSFQAGCLDCSRSVG